MYEYTPDAWLIVKVNFKGEVYHKVLAGWLGNYPGGDSWRLSSKIVECYKDEDYFMFEHESGSLYRCHKNLQKFTSTTTSIFSHIVENYNAKILPKETDWINYNWS